LIENWNGSSWSVVPSPTATVENTSLNAVAAISPSNVWAVGGNGGTVLVEHFDGRRWSVVHSPVFGSGEGTAISADSANDIWVVDGGTFLHFNGTKWSSVASAIGTASESTSVTALSPTNAWAVGTVVNFRTAGRHPVTVPKAAIEHWDGTSWSIVASTNPNPSGPSGLDGIAAISANDIWAVGSMGGVNGVATAQTLTEHWDGTSWSIIPSPSPAANQNELFAVTALSDGTVVAVGHQEDVNTDQPLILQNAASAPQLTNGPMNAATTNTTLTRLDIGRQDRLLLAGTNADQPLSPRGNGITGTLATTPLRAALLDELFAAAGKGNRPLPLAGRAWWAQGAARDATSDSLAEGLWRWDRV
jgi:hypothetical protein